MYINSIHYDVFSEPNDQHLSLFILKKNQIFCRKVIPQVQWLKKSPSRYNHTEGMFKG